VPFKQPRPILEGIYAFAPNRATLGGTAYFIVEKDQKGDPANLLIDAPAHDPETLNFIKAQGGVKSWVITHRGAIGAAKALQAALTCNLIMQEQETYLLPDVPQIQGFPDQYDLGPDLEVLWTPGHSPGSACVYLARHGGVLFTGRHLLPDAQGHLQPLRFSKTFHWPRQLQSVKKLQDRFSAETLAYVCPGANTGFLRGEHIVRDAYHQLAEIDVTALRQAPALL
jgi:glyoxylase-like metal-dependent hydrolase (beta-lactamase superfamily II)